MRLGLVTLGRTVLVSATRPGLEQKTKAPTETAISQTLKLVGGRVRVGVRVGVRAGVLGVGSGSGSVVGVGV